MSITVVYEDGMRRCIYCAEWYHADMGWCPHCSRLEEKEEMVFVGGRRLYAYTMQEHIGNGAYVEKVVFLKKDIESLNHQRCHEYDIEYPTGGNR